MILDSSVIVEIVLKHAGVERLRPILAAATYIGVGAPTLTETAIVLRQRLGFDPKAELDLFLRSFEIEVIAFGDAHWREASLAFGRYGKGRHPAALNFGDCLSYATSRIARLPLLYIGDDFARTDVTSAG